MKSSVLFSALLCATFAKQRFGFLFFLSKFSCGAGDQHLVTALSKPAYAGWSSGANHLFPSSKPTLHPKVTRLPPPHAVIEIPGIPALLR
ncbi:MAG TPA: hypothetical protein DCK99_16000 [Blastocatellia bacterium]|nr:hypothetical protein [Blastocatellia bacterium]